MKKQKFSRQDVLDRVAAIPVQWEVWKDGSIRDENGRCPLCSLAHHETGGAFTHKNLHEEAVKDRSWTIRPDDMLAITGAADLPDSKVAIIKTTREQMLTMFSFRKKA
jgi:hypothetical protein